jgi:hypothetical protein
MYIIAIGWVYVILMVAATSGSLIKGLGIFLFLGAAPLFLFSYIADAPQRRLRRARQMANQLNAGHFPDFPDQFDRLGEHANKGGSQQATKCKT